MIEPKTTAFVSQSEVLSALSHALDLTEGQPLGHTLRACVIGMRLAESMGLTEDDREALYYALLLKDAGCSSNAARMSTLFGSDDQPVKYGMKLVDWHRKLPLAWATLRISGLRHFMRIARSGDVTRKLIEVRCDRGAEIVRRLGFPEDAARAVRCLDEHWCGLGYPDGLRADEIPILKVIYRAGLLHDIGKLGISNQILDKPGRLTDEERKTIELHPLYSWEVLSRVTAFSEFARMASLHHEKLDGSGYPWGVPGEELDGPARVLCVVDIYEALTADRPYRAGMTREAALAIIERDTPSRLCGDTVEGLRAYLAA